MLNGQISLLLIEHEQYLENDAPDNHSLESPGCHKEWVRAGQDHLQRYIAATCDY